MVLGFNVAFFPQHFLGALGMPRRIYTYPPGAGWTLWSFVSTVGAFILALGIALFVVNALVSLRRGARAPADPWDGRTLEWRTSSPPPLHDFDEIPPVYSRDTFWREKYGDRHGRQPVPRPPLPEPHGIHLPAPSFWPFVAAVGVLAAAFGALTHVALVVAGVLVTVVALFAFALEHHRDAAYAHQIGVLEVDHRKAAVWTFLGSECFFFGSLIATYLAYKGRSVVGPHPHELEQSLRKGHQVFIEGHLRMDQWVSNQDGQKRSKLVVVVDNESISAFAVSFLTSHNQVPASVCIGTKSRLSPAYI